MRHINSVWEFQLFLILGITWNFDFLYQSPSFHHLSKEMELR